MVAGNSLLQNGHPSAVQKGDVVTARRIPGLNEVAVMHPLASGGKRTGGSRGSQRIPKLSIDGICNWGRG
eukprot:1761268-Pyramimonas_sp.AAC.1